MTGTMAIAQNGFRYNPVVAFSLTGGVTNPIQQGILSQIKEQSDYQQAFSWLDAGTDNERVDNIVHSSATLGLFVTETFGYNPTAPYRVMSITLS